MLLFLGGRQSYPTMYLLFLVLFGVDFDRSRFRTLCLNRELGIVLFFIIDSHLVFLKVRVTFIDNGTFLAPLPLALKVLLE